MGIQDVIDRIAEKLKTNEIALTDMWKSSAPVKYFYIDDLLPLDIVEEASTKFPDLSNMNRRSSIREKKYTSANMNLWGDQTKNVFLALQSEQVLEIMQRITGIEGLVGDLKGYAGGISAMQKGDFLNPHLDNSSHPKIEGYRRLNALYYVTNGWSQTNGGNLELWSPDLKQRVELTSLFNRLIVMNTNNQSLHSVNKVIGDGVRKCISNYYFTKASPTGSDYHHITSFRGRPDEFFKDMYLRLEGYVGSRVQSIVGKPLKKGEL